MKTIQNGVIGLLISYTLLACQSTGQPNQDVRHAFTQKFGKVPSVSWTHNSDYSFAHFKQHGHLVVAVFGNDGQWIDTEPAQPID